MIARGSRATTAGAVRLAAVGAILATGAAAIGLLLMPIPAVWDSPWVSAVLDLGHLPLFAVLTVVAVWAAGRPFAAALAVGLFASLIEIVQRRFGRSGDLGDLIRSLLGMAIGWGLLAWTANRRRGRSNRSLAIGLLLLFVWPVIETVPVFLDAAAGLWNFPVLSDFRAAHEMVRWRPYQADHERRIDAAAPSGWVYRLTMHPGPSPYSGVRFLPVVRDWSNKKEFVLRIRTEGEPIQLGLTILDFRGEREAADRFNFGKVFPPGRHELKISLADVAKAPTGRPLDLSAVRSVALFASKLQSDRSLVVEELRLE